MVEATAQLNQMPSGNRLLIKSKRGSPTVNPLVGVIRRAQRDAVHFGTLLGLSPSARASLASPRPVEDRYDEFFA